MKKLVYQIPAVDIYLKLSTTHPKYLITNLVGKHAVLSALKLDSNNVDHALINPQRVRRLSGLLEESCNHNSRQSRPLQKHRKVGND